MVSKHLLGLRLEYSIKSILVPKILEWVLINEATVERGVPRPLPGHDLATVSMLKSYTNGLTNRWSGLVHHVLVQY